MATCSEGWLSKALLGNGGEARRVYALGLGMMGTFGGMFGIKEIFDLFSDLDIWIRTEILPASVTLSLGISLTGLKSY